VLSDYVHLACLMDVFILEEWRGRGFSAILLVSIFSDEKFQQVKIWRLGTDDAQGLYQKYGFQTFPFPEKMMEWKRS